MLRFNIPTVLTAISAVFLFAGSAAQAEMMKFTAELTGAAQVPPADSAATGTVEVTLDTEAKMVAWVVTTEGLSGEPTASHIHGPASAAESAGPVIDTMATMEGSAPITDEQITDLTGGMYYYNVHTEKFPDGEIRGQLMAAE
jgi:Cu/Zn superoxide dismutase